MTVDVAEDEAATGFDNFEDLYRDSRDDVYAYVAGLLRDRVAAEDVTALAFEKACRKWDRFDPRRGSPRGWLFGIARNAALDELRRRRREVRLTHEPAIEDPAPTLALEELERQESVARAVAALPATERELISLKFFAGLGNSEIAEATGLSASNVGTRIHRTITKLRDACQEEAANGN